MPDIYLYSSQANPTDIQLLDLTRTFYAATPDAGSVQLVAYEPLKFPMGLQLVGYLPTVTQAGGGPSDTTLTPTVGSLLFTGTGSLLGFNVLGSTGTLTCTGQAGLLGFTLLGASGTLTGTGYGSRLDFGMVGANGTLTLTGVLPTVNYTESYTLIPGGGILLVVGFQPTVSSSGGVVSVRRRHFAKGWGHV